MPEVEPRIRTVEGWSNPECYIRIVGDTDDVERTIDGGKTWNKWCPCMDDGLPYCGWKVPKKGTQ